MVTPMLLLMFFGSLRWNYPQRGGLEFRFLPGRLLAWPVMVLQAVVHRDALGCVLPWCDKANVGMPTL